MGFHSSAGPRTRPTSFPLGFADLRPVPADGARDLGQAQALRRVEWRGLRIWRAGGRHGREEAMVRGLGPMSGFVVAAPGEPTVYVAGDTVWCAEVATAVADHRPDWIVVNAGGARFLEGGTITMEAADAIAVAGAASGSHVVATHMEAINHCPETRADLGAALRAAGLDDRVAIPADGETLVS